MGTKDLAWHQVIWIVQIQCINMRHMNFTPKACGPCGLRLYFLSEGGALLETHASTQTHSSAHSALCSHSLQGRPKILPTMHLVSAHKAPFFYTACLCWWTEEWVFGLGLAWVQWLLWHFCHLKIVWWAEMLNFVTKHNMYSRPSIHSVPVT